MMWYASYDSGGPGSIPVSVFGTQSDHLFIISLRMVDKWFLGRPEGDKRQQPRCHTIPVSRSYRFLSPTVSADIGLSTEVTHC